MLRYWHYCLFGLSFVQSFSLGAQQFEIGPIPQQYRSAFEAAYQIAPEAPPGLFEAVAYTQSRLQALRPDQQVPSCLGLPAAWGPMALVADGKGYFRNSLHKVAQLAEVDTSVLKYNPEAQLQAYATAYAKLQAAQGVAQDNWAGHCQLLFQLSELPSSGRIGDDFALDSYLYTVLQTMREEAFARQINQPAAVIDLLKVFGPQNLKVLQAARVELRPDGVQTATGQRYQKQTGRFPCTNVSSSFPHAVIQTSAHPSNYSSRNGTAISHITVHTMQGSYAGSISWFQNPAANVSAHYNIRAVDGQITQMVCEEDKAWHVGNSNPYSIGLEHEGYIDDPAWYTNVSYEVSAQLAKDIAQRYNMPLQRIYDQNGDQGLNPISDNCYRIKGHQHFPNQTHVDPGPYWNWNRYYDLIYPQPEAPIDYYTTCSGSFTDPGGSNNYSNDTRHFYLIEPNTAGTVQLQFNSFDLETDYDFLYVYDGENTEDSLLAVLTGNQIPTSLTAQSGKMLLEFRSDCGIDRPGWEVSWTCQANAPSCAAPEQLQFTVLNPTSVRLSWAAVPTATAYEVRYRNSITADWNYRQTTQPELQLSGLALDGEYLWGVRALCGGAASSISGARFVLQSSGNQFSSSACEGLFSDTGGELGNYRNNEDYWFTIQPSAGAPVELSFQSFDLESNYDYMYFYDGVDGQAPAIGGPYTGSSLPPTIVANSGALTVHFQSDGWTTRSGWEASWQCSSTIPSHPNTILLDENKVGQLNCGIAYHNFYDSGGSTSDYGANEAYVQTFCHPDTSKSVRLSFRPHISSQQQIDLKSTSQHNDYLFVYDGPSTQSNLVGVHTGGSSFYPQPGSYISSGSCLTVRMDSDDQNHGVGWSARLYCADRPTDMGRYEVGGTAGTASFTDTGGSSGSYGNNENYVVSYCPEAGLPSHEGVWADFSALPVYIEQNWDYLYVFDGPSIKDSPLLAVFTGDANDRNRLGILKATLQNASGCLTFQFFSDIATVEAGWEAQIYTGPKRLGFGAEDCAEAQPITTAGGIYAGSTTLATGRPGNPDPSLDIALAHLPSCSGSNTITHLENTLWYKFTMPDTLCTATAVNLRLDNISCQMELSSGSGVQLILYERDSCEVGSNWGSPVFCADKLDNGSQTDVGPYLQAGRSYYLLIDGFAGQNCNFDFRLEFENSSSNSCLLPLDLLYFEAWPDLPQGVQLEWHTEAEEEVRGYQITRARADGHTFENIGYMPAQGPPTAYYQFLDTDYRPNSINYYRLRALHHDGSLEWLPIRAVDLREPNANQLRLYPNPSSDWMRFEWADAPAGQYELHCFDAFGRLILEENWEIQTGLRQEIDLQNWESGIYFYRLQGPLGEYSGQFSVAH